MGICYFSHICCIITISLFVVFTSDCIVWAANRSCGDQTCLPLFRALQSTQKQNKKINKNLALPLFRALQPTEHIKRDSDSDSGKITGSFTWVSTHYMSFLHLSDCFVITILPLGKTERNENFSFESSLTSLTSLFIDCQLSYLVTNAVALNFSRPLILEILALGKESS